MPDIFIEKKPEHPKKTAEVKENTPQTAGANPTSNPDNMHANKTELLHNLGIKSHGGKVHAFSSYFEDPSKVKFKNKLYEEILILFLRRHFVTNFPWIVKAIAMALVPIIFEVLATTGLYSSGFVDPAGKFIIYFFYYFFIISGYIFVNYMTWFYNISLVTNVRIVDIDFSDIVFEDVAATKFSQVEDVQYSQIGIFRSVFDFGDVHTQTAGTKRNFEFLAVPHPENVIRIINSLIGRKKHV